jgi:hypothetical protein
MRPVLYVPSCRTLRLRMYNNRLKSLYFINSKIVLHSYCIRINVMHLKIWWLVLGGVCSKQLSCVWELAPWRAFDFHPRRIFASLFLRPHKFACGTHITCGRSGPVRELAIRGDGLTPRASRHVVKNETGRVQLIRIGIHMFPRVFLANYEVRMLLVELKKYLTYTTQALPSVLST